MDVAYEIKFPEELAAAVELLARRTQRPVADIVRTVVEAYVEAIEDAADAEAAERILADPESEWIPWEDVKADLGL